VTRVATPLPAASEMVAAVRSGRVFVADGNRYFNRPGPSIVDSLWILLEPPHPADFPPTFLDRGWVPFPG